MNYKLPHFHLFVSSLTDKLSCEKILVFFTTTVHLVVWNWLSKHAWKKKNNKYSAPPTGFEGRINALHAQFWIIIIIIIIIIITLFMSQVYLAEHTVVLLIGETGNPISTNVCFWWEGKTGVSGEKPLGAEERTNKLNPHMTSNLGIEPGPHWWKASALTTAPTLLSPLRQHCSYRKWTESQQTQVEYRN